VTPRTKNEAMAFDDGLVSRTATAVRTGQASAKDVLDQYLNRITAGNGRLNAIVANRIPAARLEARALDERISRGLPVGPLAGVPFTVKDVLATADLPTTCGSRVLAGYQTARDATVVARMREAGALLVGKTNCPEFAFGIDTDNALYGRTRNPCGDFSPGGSSGGEAAAVAARFSALGIGTDFGGSIRWPAQCVGIVGLRPTVGRLPGTGQVPGVTDHEPLAPNARSFQGRIQVPGLLAGSVSDLEIALRVASGPDGIDALAVPVPLADSGDIRTHSLEVRWGAAVAGQAVASGVADAAAFAADVFAREGARVEVGLPAQLDYAVELYAQLRETDALTEIARVAAGHEEKLTPFIRELLLDGPTTSETAITRLWTVRARLAGELSGWLHGNRLLLLPVSSRPPPWASEHPEYGQAQFAIVANCRATSMFGLPVLSVPCAATADGRPVSVQLVAPPFREDLLFAAGRCIERHHQGAT
jgi:amidase